MYKIKFKPLKSDYVNFKNSHYRNFGTFHTKWAGGPRTKSVPFSHDLPLVFQSSNEEIHEYLKYLQASWSAPNVVGIAGVL
jgi:hypothetical protein